VRKLRAIRDWLRRPDRLGPHADWLVVALLTGVAVVGILQAGIDLPWSPPLVLLLVMIGVLFIRRDQPDIVLAVQFVLGLFVLQNLLMPAGLTMIAGCYSAAVYSRRRLFSLGLVLAGSGLTAIWHQTGTGSTVAFLLLVAWLIGTTVRGYRERGVRREREREARRRVVAAEERARIARELHDVVAHSVSVMVVQAEAARTQVDRDPAATKEALASISATGREAMSELRHILGVLDQHGEEADSAPQPDLAQVDSLVGRLRDAGLPVVLRVEGAAHDLPPGLAVTAYRIVQEALTNALKHTGSARTEVVIRYGEHELTLEVTDDGGPARTAAADGAGRGLLGMRERVAAYGGELEAGPRPGRGYAVRARLPLAV
jgi:signal transduction histidine kinase